LAIPLAVQPRIGIALGFVRVVAAPLSLEACAVSIAALLGLKALLRSPGFDQRAVDGEVLLGQMRLCLLQHSREELAGRGLVQKPFPVLGKHGMVPDRLVHLQPHKPTE
jgi:hypothetical protein